jgi:YegS/Rv2252/BmrU family lipid kinase
MNLTDKTNKLLFIVNLEANEKRSITQWKQVKSDLDDRNIEHDVEFPTKREETVDLVAEDEEHDSITTVSGDGGFNAMVEGAMKNDREKTLSVIPAGTANDIARTFDIYSNPQRFYETLASETLLNRRVSEVDVGEVNGHYFLGHASLGFDVATLEEREKRRFLKGKLAYVAAGFRALLKYKSKKMRVKLGEEETDKIVFAMIVSNIKYYADGMLISPDAEPDDGWLDLCLIEGKSNLRTLAHNFHSVYSGNHVNNREVYYTKTKGLEIFCQEPVSLQVDGDPIGKDNHFKFKIADRGLKVLV